MVFFTIKRYDETRFSMPEGEPTTSGTIVLNEPCLDCDEGCLEVDDVRGCYLYAPERGYCVFLQGDK